MADFEQLLEAAPMAISGLIDRARRMSGRGDFSAARGLYERALDSMASPNDPALAAVVIRWIGDTHRDGGDLDAARDCYVASRAIAEACGDLGNQGYAANSLGILEWFWGRVETATDFYAIAERFATEVGDDRLLAMVKQNQGILQNVKGSLDAALELYAESLERYRKLNDRRRMAGVMSNIGMLHADQGRWDEAEAMYTQSADLCDVEGEPRSRLMVEVNRTELSILRGDLEDALRVCDAAFVLSQEVDHPLALGEVHKNYGVIYRKSGKVGLAETHLREATETGRRLENPFLVAESSRELAEVYRIQERNTDALQALNLSHQIFTELHAGVRMADVEQRLAELEAIYLEIVSRWGESIESKDRYTAGHCQRVAEYACRLAERMGFSRQTLTWFRMGALLHDLGKTMVPARILNKQGQLSRGEWDIMRSHAAAGDHLLSSVDFPWDIRPMVRSHHERWDGRGYPDGLAGEEIPLAARILCVADVYDALTTTRSYRPAYLPEEALDIMKGDSGTIFDPRPLELFESIVRTEILPIAVADG